MGNDSDDEEELTPEDIEKKYETYTYAELIRLVLEHCPNDNGQRIKAICDWRLKSNENFL